MQLDVSQIRFICSNEFEPTRFDRLNKMIDKIGLDRSIIKFDCKCYKHTITDDIYNKHVRTSICNYIPWCKDKYQRKSDLSLILNYLYNLEDIERSFDDGIFIIFESDVDIKSNFNELPNLIRLLKDNYGKWDAVHFGQDGHNGENDKRNMWQQGYMEDITTANDTIRLERRLGTRCTDSHIISMTGVKKLLNYYRKNTDYYIPIDYYFSELFKSNLEFKYYWSDPTYCFQMSNVGLDNSTIKDV